MANTDEAAIFLVQLKQFDMAIEFDVAEDCIEFADAGEERAGDSVQRIEEHSAK